MGREHLLLWESITSRAGRKLNMVGFDQDRKKCLLLCSEAVESKLVKLETSWAVILRNKVSVWKMEIKLLI